MKMFAKRIQIAKMLIEGYNYQAIKGFVKVTDPTIAKISNRLETGGEGLRTAISYLQKIEKEIDKERMRLTPNLKKQYPSYFLPEIVLGEIAKTLKKRQKKKSTKRYITP